MKFECKVHLNGKRFYVGLFNTLEEALTAQSEKRSELLEAAKQDPSGKVHSAARTTGEDEMEKLKATISTGGNLDKVSMNCIHHAQTVFLGSDLDFQVWQEQQHNVQSGAIGRVNIEM